MSSRYGQKRGLDELKASELLNIPPLKQIQIKFPCPLNVLVAYSRVEDQMQDMFQDQEQIQI